jgi:hypothetical protein
MAHPKSSYNPIPSGKRKDVSAKIQIQWEALYCGARGLGTIPPGTMLQERLQLVFRFWFIIWE